MQTPPSSAATWPSSDVPVPKAMTGVPCGRRSHDRRHLVGGAGEGDRVGRVARVVGHVLAVLLAHRRRGGKPLADQRADLGDRRARIGRGLARTGAAAVMADPFRLSDRRLREPRSRPLWTLMTGLGNCDL